MPPNFICLRSYMVTTIKRLNSSSATECINSEFCNGGDKTGLGNAGLLFQIYASGTRKIFYDSPLYEYIV